MSSLSKRLMALEAAAGAKTDHAEAKRFSADLMSFIKAVFPHVAHRSRMDDLASCCGLPNAAFMRGVLAEGFSAGSFKNAAEAAYGDAWQEPMRETLEDALTTITDARGDEGLMQFAKVFPPVLTASRVALGMTEEPA